MSDDAFAVFRRRLASRFDPSVHCVLLVNVVPARTTERSDTRVNTPPHFLAAAWPPAARGPTRWPEVVVIGSPAPDNALAELCNRLPADVHLFLVDADAVDAALAGEILLAADRNLEPYQRDGVRAFVAAERARVAARVAQDYTDRDPGFERFRDALTPPESQ
jgi:hypothetical protein